MVAERLWHLLARQAMGISVGFKTKTVLRSTRSLNEKVPDRFWEAKAIRHYANYFIHSV
jgi:hypothetical protein